jgi:hypothetical protein
LAAPESFLPSALTAFGKHVRRLHFLRKLFNAAPASGLPFLPSALLEHVSCVMRQRHNYGSEEKSFHGLLSNRRVMVADTVASAAPEDAELTGIS